MIDITGIIVADLVHGMVIVQKGHDHMTEAEGHGALVQSPMTEEKRERGIPQSRMVVLVVS